MEPAAKSEFSARDCGYIQLRIAHFANCPIAVVSRSLRRWHPSRQSALRGLGGPLAGRQADAVSACQRDSAAVGFSRTEETILISKRIQLSQEASFGSPEASFGVVGTLRGGVASRLAVGLAFAAIACSSAFTSGRVLAASSGAVAAPIGGTITFTGAIVAPPFDIGVQSGAATPVGGAFATRANASGPSASVTFATPPGGEPQATVAVTSPAGLAQHEVAGRFADATGRAVAADRTGAYHVGARGGVLSLGPATGAVRPTAPVTVVVSYN